VCLPPQPGARWRHGSGGSSTGWRPASCSARSWPGSARPPWGCFASPRDRGEAGERLGQVLAGLVRPPVVVLGIPRGGVVVAARVAARLGAPLDVVVPRKVGAP